MEFSFFCHGHENLLGAHKATLEFTAENHLTKNGDCIIGVSAQFDLQKLLKFIEHNKDRKITAQISCGELRDTFTFYLNPSFSDAHEMVIRKTDFISTRTLGIRSDKAAADISRTIIEKAKDKNTKLIILLKA
jgi:hypothetical protein